MSKIGVIAALPFEAACFTHHKIPPGTYHSAHNLYVYHAGMGAVNATQAAQSLIELNIDALVSWGVAAALHPTLVSGDIVLPRDVIDSNKHRYEVNNSWYMTLEKTLKQEGVHSGGRLVSTRVVQHDPQLKVQLYQTTGAIALDMESVAVAKAAYEANLPFVIIRTIFDPVSMRIPRSSTDATNQYGQVSMSRLVSGLIRKPADLLQYPTLVSSFAKAKRSLHRVVKLCGDDLCFTEAV